MNESILNGILIFSILQALLFSLLFLTKRKKSLPDILIGILLSILAIQTFLIFFIHNDLINNSFIFIPIIISLLYGPVQYLYVLKICSGNAKIQIHDLLHFISILFFSIISITFHTSTVFIKILAATSSVSGLAYCISSLHLLIKHKVNIRKHFSFTEKVNLSWLHKVVIGFILIWSGAVILVFLRRIFNISISLDWFYIAIPAFIFYIGYHGIKQQVIFSFEINAPESNSSSVNKEDSIINKEIYKKSGLQPIQMQVINEKMLYLMKSENLYRQSSLSLQDLSDKLNIPPHHITQTLREFNQQNFYDFVNSYRINEFKQRVDKGDAKKFSLLGIAFDCGFNSKSSFNRIFKKSTGLTPSEYKSKQT
jgi:AraC-like DNA-binding protein